MPSPFSITSTWLPGASHAPVAIVAMSGNSGSLTLIGGAICGHAADVANGRAACEMEKTNEGEAEDDNEQCPPTDPAECGDDAALPEGCAGVQCLLQHASPLRLGRPAITSREHGEAALQGRPPWP